MKSKSLRIKEVKQMYVNLLIKEEEFRDAFIEIIATLDMSIVCQVISFDEIKLAPVNSIFATDYVNEDVESALPLDRTLFLNPFAIETNRELLKGRYVAYKYSRVETIIPLLKEIYCQYTGDDYWQQLGGNIYAVIGDSETIDFRRYSKRLASELVYRGKKTVCILSMKFINEYGSADYPETNYSKLMYYESIGRDWSTETFFAEDERGVFCFRQPSGVNPIIYHNQKEQEQFLQNVVSRFDAVIIDIGTIFSKTNSNVIMRATHCFAFRKKAGTNILESFFDVDTLEKFTIINANDGIDACDIKLNSILTHMLD